MRRRKRNARRPGGAVDRRCQRLGQIDHLGGRIAAMDFVSGDDGKAPWRDRRQMRSERTQRAGNRAPVNHRPLGYSDRAHLLHHVHR
jgi:hypothetical protein